MSDQLTVVHFGGNVCHGSCWSDRQLTECQQPTNGTLVNCGVCGAVGVLPDPGHLADFFRAEAEARGATVTERDGVMSARWS